MGWWQARARAAADVVVSAAGGPHLPRAVPRWRRDVLPPRAEKSGPQRRTRGSDHHLWRDQKSPTDLLARLALLEEVHDEATYYATRKRFNTERDADPKERAAWFIYLNRTCYNGLFRTNQSGEFNVPIGRYASPRIVDAPRLRAASKALRQAKLLHADFVESMDLAKRGDFVYLDPPYVPLSATSSFAAYDGGFSMRDQEALAKQFAELDKKGCLLALSNSDTPQVRELYAKLDITKIDAPRSISANAAVRGTAPEVLVRNRACIDAARG